MYWGSWVSLPSWVSLVGAEAAVGSRLLSSGGAKDVSMTLEPGLENQYGAIEPA